MRKLAPMFLTTSILALAAGNALALGDMHKHKAAPSTDTSSSSTMSTDTSSSGTLGASNGSSVSSAASPTVPSNSMNPQDKSYTDKSNTSPGTNAKLDSNSGYASSTAGTPPMTGSKSTDATAALANDDKHALSRQSYGEKGTIASNDAADTTAPKAKHHAKKKAKKKVARNDTTNPTSGAAANSVTGRSPGGDSSSSGGASGSSGSSSSGSSK